VPKKEGRSIRTMRSDGKEEESVDVGKLTRARKRPAKKKRNANFLRICIASLGWKGGGVF